MSDEKFVEPGSEEQRNTEPVRVEIDEPRSDERAERAVEPEEDDSWLYECSITAD